MTGTWLLVFVIIWIVVWIAGFALGALLAGPAVYHRQLRRAIRRIAAQERLDLDPDEIARRIGDL